jgi:hypothetical protein
MTIGQGEVEGTGRRKASVDKEMTRSPSCLKEESYRRGEWLKGVLEYWSNGVLEEIRVGSVSITPSLQYSIAPIFRFIH